MKRVRLSEWARDQGIARATAYRFLKQGILPVPVERSPTGRWYVLAPNKKGTRNAIYARAGPGNNQIQIINHQVARVAAWAADRRVPIFTVVHEIADPLFDPTPRLERLLSDAGIGEILVDNPGVLGVGRMSLLVAALAPQGRRITTVRTTQWHRQQRIELKATLQEKL